MSNYRKIYEQYHGLIPKDESGRSYEIHHVDSNHKNNSPENLIAITIQKHYDIHYSQGDWGACQAIAVRMNKSHKEISELASKSAQQRVKDGTHHLLGGEISRKITAERLANGTHNLLRRPDGTSQGADQVANGTHNFLGGAIVRKTNQRRVADGSHTLLKENMIRLSCPHCPKTGFRNMKRYHFDNCKLKP